MLNLNHFYYFYKVAETGSVTAASRALHISQPALSKQLKIFGRALETKLFEKQGRGLRLTPTGLSLFGQARGIFEKAEYLSREFASIPSIVNEQIRLGLGASIERSFASEIVGEFFKLFSDKEAQRYSLSISTLDGDVASRYLREHVIDICLTERGLSGAGIFEAASILSPICLIVPAKFAQRLNRVNKQDLRASLDALDLPWIVPSTNLGFRHEVERVLEKIDLELRPILESDSMMTIVRSVENGIGLALVPQHYCKAAHNPKRIVILNKLRSIPNVTLSLWVRRVEKESVFVKKMVRAFEKSRYR